MFRLQEIEDVMAMTQFVADYDSVRQSLVNIRLDQPLLIREGAEDRLEHFVEGVMASAPAWSRETRTSVCRTAAEIAEVLAQTQQSTDETRTASLRSAILYELAGMPALAASAISLTPCDKTISDFIRREAGFRSLGTDERSVRSNGPVRTLAELAFVDDAIAFEANIHDLEPSRPEKREDVSAIAAQIAESVNLGFRATDLFAYDAVLKERTRAATNLVVTPELLPLLHRVGFPAELLPPQAEAVRRGLLDTANRSWGFAAPTGSGKTFLARLLIIQLLALTPDAKVIYLVPSRALVHEVAMNLQFALRPLRFPVLALSAQLVDLDETENKALDNASVLVMTPEKADLLLRIGAEFLNKVSLTVIDEAHHLESGTRGALLELYLWRLRKLLGQQTRFIFLSAVTPNIDQIASWMDDDSQSVTYPHRSTRMRIGVYSISGKGASAQGVINYVDRTRIVLTNQAEGTLRRQICQLATLLHPAGPVLIVAKGKAESEGIAKELVEFLQERMEVAEDLTTEEVDSDIHQRLDARLEREMYSDVPMRELLMHRVAYHHAGLPPNVRVSVEDAIRNKQVDYVVATTTLAEGVNFPFSSVVVQSLALQDPPEKGRPRSYSPVTPRTFWNIAGRAGRPGFDSEGQVILFEPSLGLSKINAVLSDYTNSDMATLAPVRSALAAAIRELRSDLAEGKFNAEDLSKPQLPPTISRRARGAVNLLRIGVVHARAERLDAPIEDIVTGSFANRFLDADEKDFASQLVSTQAIALQRYLSQTNAPPIEMVAELGLSLETLDALRAYVASLEDWKIKRMGRLFYGGNLNLEQAKYIVGPVAKHMTELEGRPLGGFLSEIIVNWLSGVPMTVIKSETGYEQRLEELISVIYSRIQYLLPWGLWATDWILEQEATLRQLEYNNEVRRMAYLADAGVPNMDALSLALIGIERVDATRIAIAFQRSGGLKTGVDCRSWLLNTSRDRIERAVHGIDGRRLDHKFFEILAQLRA